MTHAEFNDIISHNVEKTGLTEEQVIRCIFSIRSHEMTVIPAHHLLKSQKIKYINSDFEGFIINDYSDAESSVYTSIVTQFVLLESVLSLSFDFKNIIPLPAVE